MEQSDINKSLFGNSNEEDYLNDFDEKISKEELREKALSIQDPQDVGADEYVILLDYAIANIYSVLRNQIKTKIPNRDTISDMANEAISLTFATYDLQKAIKSNATIRTHLGWKTKQVVTNYARDLKKALRNELNTADEDYANSLEQNKILASQDGQLDSHHDIDMNEYHDTDKFNYEHSKKIDWAMRQVRFELPRENNLILDVGIGEILKSDDTTFNLTEWADFTGQKVEYVRAIYNATKILIRKKIERKGLLDIIVDEEKTSEDFIKDTNIQEVIKQQEEDQSIMESTDIASILEEVEELISSSSLKDIIEKDDEND